jgi:hypothetical protein
MTRPKRELLHAAGQLARLVKICGVFGSDHDGEVLVAARKADQLVRDLGLTWPDVINPEIRSRIVTGGNAANQNHDAPRRGMGTSAGIRSELALLRRNLDALTPWEREFVFSLGHFHKITDRQRAVVDRLVLKVRRAA